jgi:hypothetical protein
MFLSFAKWGGGAHDASWRTMAQAETAQRAGAIRGSTSPRSRQTPDPLTLPRTGDSMESSRQEIVPEPILAFKTSIWCSKTVLNPIQNFISKFS